MSADVERAPVIQADRDFAARWAGHGPDTNDRIRAGELDHLPSVQATARHRLAALSPEPAAVNDVVGTDKGEKLAFTFAFARGFQIADETSQSCASTMDLAWEEWLAARPAPSIPVGDAPSEYRAGITKIGDGLFRFVIADETGRASDIYEGPLIFIIRTALQLAEKPVPVRSKAPLSPDVVVVPREATEEMPCPRCNDKRTVPDNIGLHSYPEKRPCPSCTDGTWAHADALAAPARQSPEQAESGEVVQADRDAAADLLDAVGASKSDEARIFAMRSGGGIIDGDKIVQAFKAHRLSTLRATPQGEDR